MALSEYLETVWIRALTIALFILDGFLGLIWCTCWSMWAIEAVDLDLFGADLVNLSWEFCVLYTRWTLDQASTHRAELCFCLGQRGNAVFLKAVVTNLSRAFHGVEAMLRRPDHCKHLRKLDGSQADISWFVGDPSCCTMKPSAAGQKRIRYNHSTS